MESTALQNILLVLFVIVNYKIIQNFLDKDLSDFSNPTIYIISRCYSYFFGPFAVIYYIERLFYPHRRELRRAKMYQKIIYNFTEKNISNNVINEEFKIPDGFRTWDDYYKDKYSN